MYTRLSKFTNDGLTYLKSRSKDNKQEFVYEMLQCLRNANAGFIQ